MKAWITLGGMMRLLSLFAFACVAAVASAPLAFAKPPLEAFGDVASIRSMQLSPDGKRVAYLQRVNGEDTLFIYELATKQRKGLARVSSLRARYLQFVGPDRLVLVASKDVRTFGFRGRYEASGAFSFDIETGKTVQLLLGTRNIFPAQGGLGQIIGVAPGGRDVFMPAYMSNPAADPDYDLLRVPLDTGKGFDVDGGRGTSKTTDWLVDTNGKVVVREDFNERAPEHSLRARQANGEWKVIYRNRTPLPAIGVVGLSEDASSIYTVDSGDSEFVSLYKMNITDGTTVGPVSSRDDAEIEDIISNNNRIVYGVRYSGMFPSYDMFDDAIEAEINGVMQALNGSSVYLTSWSDDWSKMLFLASGGANAERYMLYDRTTKSLALLAAARPEITPKDVGEVTTIEYKARDGLTIPALITWPAGVAEADRKNLPLVVMPHGGPQAYDSVGFDWLAQFVANEGYLVLQPNFRGSAGFGNIFANSGHGEWGRKMQDDITDGANALAKMGWADRDRMCIVGWSYGGYAALQGGASTPDMYKCVASIAGVSDLREMLITERRDHGADSRTVTWWELLIGDPDKDRAAIEAVSPALHADKFKAPVLLVHGASDTTVPVHQSEIMNDALKRANKPVEYVRIDGDDHSLVDNDSRRLMLTKLGAFLKTYLGK